MELRTWVHAGLFRIRLDHSNVSRNDLIVVLRHASFVVQSGLLFFLCPPV